MEGRDDGGGKVIGLIEKATKSSAQEVDPRLLKAIKSTLRYSDSEVRLGAKTLMELMKHNHSQVLIPYILGLFEIDQLLQKIGTFLHIHVDKSLSWVGSIIDASHHRRAIHEIKAIQNTNSREV